MKWKFAAILVIAGCAIGTLVADIPQALAASGKKKQCGGAAGATNGECPKCVGNCNFVDGGKTQKYKVCQDSGDQCEDTVDSFCTGRLMTGDSKGQGCSGTFVLDDFGVPVSCQNNKFKTCK